MNFFKIQDYCEVGYVDIDFSTTTTTPTNNSKTRSSPTLVEIKDLLTTNTLPVVGTDLFAAYLHIFAALSKSEFANMSSDAVLKLVNVDVDPGRKSNRVEWASAVYRSHYHALCAFELEIQWEIATGSLLAELVMNWSKLANRFNYHIVAAPVDPFATPIVPNSDPLRGPIFIRLNLGCLTDSEKIIFENYIRDKYKVCFDELAKCASAESSMSVSTSTCSSPAEAATAHSESFSSMNSHAAVSIESTTPTDVAASGAAQLNATLMKVLCEHCVKFDEFASRKQLAEKKSVDFERVGSVAELFDEFIEYERIIRLQFFQEAILEK
jgi:hypothetical protein